MPTISSVRSQKELKEKLVLGRKNTGPSTRGTDKPIKGWGFLCLFCAECRLCEAGKMQMLYDYKIPYAAQDFPVKQARFQFVSQPTKGPDTRTMWKQRVEMPLFLSCRN